MKRNKKTNMDEMLMEKLLQYHEQKLQLSFKALNESQEEYGWNEIQQLLSHAHKELLELIHLSVKNKKLD